MRLKTFLPASLALCLVLGGCIAYRDDRTSFLWRSEHFQAFLGDKSAIEAFKNGDSNAVGRYIEKKAATDAAFAKAYGQILEEEGIKFFTPVQTAHYFYQSIHVLIRK
ncbi:MAG: hypothetical protein J0L75_21525 [Spirochaetes bacterium]|nr:hypothetical protein [Spirochaetota bacterium]